MNDSPTLSKVVFYIGQWPIDLTSFLLGLLIIVITAAFSYMVHNYKRRLLAELQNGERARDADQHMSALLRTQAEMQGRMQTMAEIFGKSQAELNRSIREQLNGMANTLGQTLNSQTKSTHENLTKLQERLAVIDNAQNNIQSLAGQVVQLQAILSNKQTRGAFGQGRMEAIIADALPKNAYSFQATLSNNTRPDCVVLMPNAAPSLVIDAKFPLEAWNRLRDMTDALEIQKGEAQFKHDMEIHIRDIAKKYLIPGETQDTAFLFVPSESIFATVHERFNAIVEKAHQSRVIIVSPSLLMLSISVIQAILKDAHMREQAHLIQAEVGKLMEDIGRLDERVRKLQTHFSQANKDIDDILVSSSKVIRRSNRIESLELAPDHSVDKTVNHRDPSFLNVFDER